MAKKTSKAAKAPAGAPALQPGDNGAGADMQDAPSMHVIAQYLKDFSFENPNAPQSLQQPDQSPQIDVAVNVNAKTLSDTEYEVELQLDAKAGEGDGVIFAAELLYAGIFKLENIPEDSLHPVVLIECPRLLFPFARQILADATRNGGFPPLLLDPIDFAALYQQRMMEEGGTA
jgi:preprotein translocase subunit SecB